VTRPHALHEQPSRWLTDNADLLPRREPGSSVRRALDVACGRGRHALWLTIAGFDTEAVDRDAEVVEIVHDQARRLGLRVDARVEDLEVDGLSLGHQRYDVIVVFRFLHRPLFPVLRAALRVDGVLIYETFTIHQATRGKPSNPAFLLKPGELPALVHPLRVLQHREGEFDGGMVEGIVARKEAFGTTKEDLELR
jgi:SAM-dependent methyltransferase